MYAYRKNNQWYRCNLSSRFNGVGGFHLLTDEERAKHDFYRCEVVNEQYDPKTQNRSEIPMEWSLEGMIVTATYTVTEKSLQSIIAEKIDDIDKLTADAIIDIIGSDINQRNLTAKSVQLTLKVAKGIITADEQAQLDYINGLFEQVEHLRIAGNNKEAQIQACTTMKEFEAKCVELGV